MSVPADRETPRASRPNVKGYGIPETDEGLLPWSHVVERLESARTYWVATADSRGRPHVTPVWGAFVHGGLYFEGSPETRRGRDIAQNPQVAVNLESGDDVVILEGSVEELERPEPELARSLVESMTARYASSGYTPSLEQWHEGGLYRVVPRVAFAWTQFPKDVTRFTFSEQ